MILQDDDIRSRLQETPGWQLVSKEIIKEFTFDNFTKALGFVDQVGKLAEEQNHHPDIDIRYNKVLLKLSTHSEGGITDHDIKLAGDIENIPVS